VTLPAKYQDIIGIKNTDKTYKIDLKKYADARGEWAERWAKEVTPELGKLLK
jgi:putative spermidine/putrescine transport system substrate-binding protein